MCFRGSAETTHSRTTADLVGMTALYVGDPLICPLSFGLGLPLLFGNAPHHRLVNEPKFLLRDAMYVPG